MQSSQVTRAVERKQSKISLRRLFHCWYFYQFFPCQLSFIFSQFEDLSTCTQALRHVLQQTNRQRGSRIPSGGRVEGLWRGAFGMDAKRGTMGRGWPTVTTLGTVPERGTLSVAKPGCRARFLFGYFLFARAYGAKRSNSRRLARRASAASKEKVTRRKAEIGN